MIQGTYVCITFACLHWGCPLQKPYFRAEDETGELLEFATTICFPFLRAVLIEKKKWPKFPDFPDYFFTLFFFPDYPVFFPNM